MRFRSPKAQRGAVTALDITPLLDVVFLLLIFLLVTTQFKKDEEYALVLEPPTSSVENVTVRVDRTTIFVTRDGKTHLMTVPADAPPAADGPLTSKHITTEELRQKLEALHAKRPETPIAIRGEKKTAFQLIVDVWSVVRDIGFTNVSFPYQHKKDKDDDGKMD